jgi:Ni,Fe-hydrogenase I cytochrome b subunit
MEPPSPVRLFATLAGAALVIFGIVGFFFDASFARPDDIGEAVGLLTVNGWANTFHILTGALGLLLAGFASRSYVLWIGVVYVTVAVFGSIAI